MNINNTKIKYLKVNDNKIYKVNRISFFYMTIEATETNFTVDDVPEDELWDLEEFRNYKVKLINGDGGMGEIVDFSDWVNRRKREGSIVDRAFGISHSKDTDMVDSQ